MDQTNDSKINGVQKKKEKKKKHVALWVCLSIFVFLPLTLIGATIGTVHYFFYDPTKPPQPTVEGGYDQATTERVIKAAGIDSLDNTATTKEIQLLLGVDDMNNMIAGKISEMSKGGGSGGMDFSAIKQFVSGIGVRCEENNTLNFEIGASVPMLKTRAILSTKVEKSQKDVAFSIQDVSVGKVTGILDKIKNIPFAKDLIKDDAINSILGTLPISLKSDLNNNRILYPRDNIAHDINKFMGNDNGNIYSHILAEFFEDDIYKMEFVKLPTWSGLSTRVELQTLGEKSYEAGKPGEKFHDPSRSENPVDWIDYNQLTVKALNAGIITTANGDNDLKTFYNYAIRGYDRCENKTFIDGLGDLSSIGIADKHAYKGIYCETPESKKILLPTKSLKDIVTDQIYGADISLGKTIASIGEDDINAMLKSSAALGETFIIQRDLAEGTTDPKNYKMSTFTISNIYANLYADNKIDITVTISVNGYPIYLYLECTDGMIDSSTQSITFALKDENMHFGEYNASNSLKSTVFSLLGEATRQESVVEIDTVNQLIKLNMSQAINESGKGALIEALGGIKMEMTGTALGDNGAINLKL